MKDHLACHKKELWINPLEEEMDWGRLRRMAHTLRLEGDYVTAQTVERDIEQRQAELLTLF